MQGVSQVEVHTLSYDNLCHSKEKVLYTHIMFCFILLENARILTPSKIYLYIVKTVTKNAGF